MRAQKNNNHAGYLIKEKTTTGTSDVFKLDDLRSTFQVIANGTSGAFSATVLVQVSNDGTNWITGLTFSLSGTATTADIDGDSIIIPWKYVRGNVTAISGTGANVSLMMGT